MSANVQSHKTVLYITGMDVAISQLRANLREWVDQARAGHDVLVTERGIPVARLVAVEASSVIERLESEGILTRPQRTERPRAMGRVRVQAAAPVSDLISELRR